MNWERLASVDWPQVVVETLAHFVWQGLLVGCVAFVVAYARPTTRASQRYRVLVVGLIVMALCPWLTLGVVGSRRDALIATTHQWRGHETVGVSPATSLESPGTLPTPADTGTGVASQSGGTEVGPKSQFELGGTQSPSPLHFKWPSWQWCTLLSYLGGVGVLLFRLVIGVSETQRLTRRSVLPETVPLQAAIASAATRAGLRWLPRVRLCGELTVPAVVGVLRATVLLPASLVSQLPPEQLEAILVHEFIHLQRGDHWLNLLQRLVEALLFFHPAVWWITGQIRREREFACDDAVLNAGTAQASYAAGLVAVAISSRQSAGLGGTPATFDVAATGPSVSQLRQRLQRILGEPIQMKTRLTFRDGWSLLLMVALLLALPLAIQLRARAMSPLVPEPFAQESVEQHDAEIPWGDPSGGLSCRIVPVESGSDEQEPNEAVLHADGRYTTDDQVTLRVEIKNVSDRPLALCNVRYNEHWTPPAPGKSHSNWYAPFFFDLILIGDNGQQVSQARPAFGHSDRLIMISGVQVPEVGPGEVMSLLLRPGAWEHGRAYQIPPGKYGVQVVYQGVPASLLEDLSETWKDKPFSQAWSGELKSNQAVITVERDVEQELPALIWGETFQGLRAAARVLPNQASYPYGSRLTLEFQVQNVSDEEITFWSETWRQDDQAQVTTPDGQQAKLTGTFYTGLPVLMKWTLKPGQTARLKAADLGVAQDAELAKKFKHPIGRVLTGPTGQYGITFTLSFGRIQVSDGQGKVEIPGEGDWVGELTTGNLLLQVREPVEGDFPQPPRFDGQLSFHSPDGEVIPAGYVKVWDRQGADFEPQELELKQGRATVVGCLAQPLVVDVRAPGYEEYRFYEVTFDPDQPTDLELTPAAPARFRLTHRGTGQPVAGAKVRFFRRSASKVSSGPYPTDGIRGPVWAVSDQQGLVVLDSLQRVDTYQPRFGENLYHFYVEPPDGLAPMFVGPLKAGDDAGELKLQPLLEATGVIRGTKEELDAFQAEWDQPELIQGGLPEADWWYAVSQDLQTERQGDELRFHLTGLRPGKLRVVGRFAGSKDGVRHSYSRRDPTDDDWVFEIDLTESVSGWTLRSSDPRRPGGELP